AQGATAEVNRDTGNLAALLARLGRLDEAEDCMNRAIAGHRASGHLRFEGIVSGNMSLVKEIRGDPAAALTWQC
ncbi:MAG: hypothetical protein KJ044_17015, partial [Planctomycetes bacterium]|nr:hypothetical protein [Planctomycetota bacterium]